MFSGLYGKLFGSKLNLATNIFLFLFKLALGLATNSIAILSDAFNSFLDIISGIAVYLSVRVSTKHADEDHPFGHFRAEPIAALFVAMLAGVFGFEVIKTALERLILGEHFSIINEVIIILVGFTLVAKILMTIYFTAQYKKHKSPAFKAVAIDNRNDILSTGIVLAGIIGSFFGYYQLDAIAGIFIGGIIVYSGYSIGKENIDYLMGKSPPMWLRNEIKRIALTVPDVLGTNTIHAHYVGTVINVEVHIEVTQNISTKLSHDIGKKVQKRIEKLPEINKAFIHIDPV